ncbi:glycerophosphodiester phosphodiesterase [Roseburia hominis]
MGRTEIFAHRGASSYAPENTRAAFILAHKQGADGIELDVQLTKDGEVVVIHDESIDRVSDGRGAVREYTLEELRRFSFDNHMDQYGRVGIPTLREVLSLVKPWEMKLNIELKTGIYRYPRIEEKTIALVKAAGLEDRVIYSSFNHYSIRKVREIAPEAETAFLYSDVILEAENYAKAHGVDGLHPPLYLARMENLLEQYQQSHLAVRVWTVNKEDDLKWLIRAGVTAVITNRPDIALAVRRSVEQGD